MTKINYVAKLDGTIVGSRTSPRTYTHAVIIQWNAEYFRTKAFGYKADDTDRSNFKFYTKEAAHTVESYIADSKWTPVDEAAKRIADAKQRIEGGFDAYVARVRQDGIDRFEKGLEGGYQPGVATWCGRLDLARKEASKFAKRLGAEIARVEDRAPPPPAGLFSF
jgi:hypothetical protein